MIDFDRKIEKNDFFFNLKGENMSSHQTLDGK